MMRGRIVGGAVVLGLAITAPVVAELVGARATVADTATVIVANTTGTPAPAVVVNRCASSVYLGGATVETGTGLELVADASLPITLGPAETLYGIVASGTCRVDVLVSRR